MTDVTNLKSVFSDFQFDRLWIDAAINDPRTRVYENKSGGVAKVLLCPSHGICFLSNPHSVPGTEDHSWLKDTLAKAAIVGKVKYISISSEMWHPVFRTIFPKPPQFIERICYELSRLVQGDPLALVPANGDSCSVSTISKQDLPEIMSDVDPAVEQFWPAVNEFVEKGLGFCTRFEGRITSVAWSAFIPKKEIEIAVATRRDERGRGHAFLACKNLLEYCETVGIKPHWTTAASNSAARKLAAKLGFIETQRHQWLRVT